MNLVSDLDISIVVGRVDDGEIECNDAFVDSRLRDGHRVDLPSILQPMPDWIEIATCQPIVFGNRLITQARLVKKRRIETQIIYHERRQPMPRRQADIHRDAGADKE